MADELEAQFGSRPRGAWLAERVWEPDLPTSLITAGYCWTVLDDAHFRAAAIPEEALWGPYTTDDQGKVLTVFGTEQGLRYRIPFSDVDDVIGYLRDHATDAGERVGTMGDDGEKFGGWPTTYEHCWGVSGWVEKFFTALEANRDWLTTVTPSGWLDGHGPVGRVYLPTGSYAEMGEWALPPNEAVEFAAAVHEAKAAGRPEARWLRGAIWRNFQVRYREVNDLHKQMLRVSDLVDEMPAGSEREIARDHLHAGQSNDCYWHGLFGGIYLPDLRVAALHRLIAAEDLAMGHLGAAVESGVLVDLDLDGEDEALLANDGQIVAIKLDEGAGIGRWDIRAVAHPLAAVMRRRPEAYHEKVRAHERALAASVVGASRSSGTDYNPTEPASIHDIVTTKQEGLSERLRYDSYERRSGLVRLLGRDATAAAIDRGDAEDLIPVDAPWSLESIGPESMTASFVGSGVRVSKTIRVGGGRLDPLLAVAVEIVNTSNDRLEALLGIEFAVMLLGGGHNPAAFHAHEGRRIAHDERLELRDLTHLASGNDQLGLTIETRVDRPVDAWIAPIESVSNSEAGFELVYQGSSVVFVRPVDLAPGEAASIRLDQCVSVSTDRLDGGTASRL
jgi:alpha-amylase